VEGKRRSGEETGEKKKRWGRSLSGIVEKKASDKGGVDSSPERQVEKIPTRYLPLQNVNERGKR